MSNSSERSGNMELTQEIIIDTLDQDLYSRHKGIDMQIPNEIFVVGCGGTGTWVSIMSAMIGVKIIHISDHDILERHNRSRLPYKDCDIGRLKTDVLKEFILSVRPDTTIYTYDGIHTEMDMLVLTGEVVFDCNDNPEVQRMIFKYCKEHGLKYVGVGCNADHITVLENLDLMIGDNEGSPYEATPMFLIPAILSASCALWNVIKKKQKSIYVLKDISNILENGD